MRYYSAESGWYRSMVMGRRPMGQTRNPVGRVKEAADPANHKRRSSSEGHDWEEAGFSSSREPVSFHYCDNMSFVYDNGTLRVRFAGPCPDYVYYDVPPSAYQDLIDATNVELHYRQNIKPKGYRYDILI